MTELRKPRNRSGYRAEDLAQVKSALLTLAVTLGDYLEDLCIVGGVVPALLIDLHREAQESRHPGTNDLDVALALALLDDERYAELSDRLRAEGFEPDTNENGNPTVQRWKLGELRVTIDFLIPPASKEQAVHPTPRIKKLQVDFGAVVTPGLQLAFEDRVRVEISGRTLAGEQAKRTIPVCGAAAYTVLKALAHANRGEPKDAFDLVYVIENTPGGGRAVANRLAELSDRETVASSMQLLARDFATPGYLGPQRAAKFSLPVAADRDEIDEVAADAHGHVADLLSRWGELTMDSLGT